MYLLNNAIDALKDFELQCRERPGIRANSPLDLSNTLPSLLRIEIMTELLANQRISIQLVDNDPGISESVKLQLFDPFFTT